MLFIAALKSGLVKSEDLQKMDVRKEKTAISVTSAYIIMYYVKEISSF